MTLTKYLVDGVRGQSKFNLGYWSWYKSLNCGYFRVIRLCTQHGWRDLSLNIDVNLLFMAGTHALLKSNPVYDMKRHELFEHYYPLEISPDLPVDEKAKYMEEWYVKWTSRIFESSGLTLLCSWKRMHRVLHILMARFVSFRGTFDVIPVFSCMLMWTLTCFIA